MARQLDLPFVDQRDATHVRVEPCEHGGWDLTLTGENGTAPTHIHCRNWQQVERFRIGLLADRDVGKQVQRRLAMKAAASIILLLSLAQADAQPLPSEACPLGSIRGISYHVEPMPAGDLLTRFSTEQIALLEKLNRADRNQLALLPELVVPDQWLPDEEPYSPLPLHYECARDQRKLLVVYVPGQLFGAYEFGVLVRWGPVSTGGRSSPTPDGLYTLNWKSTGHSSSIDPDWYMPWYFNFGNREGLAFHEYLLPGRPASHGCIRLLSRDAQWLFNWGDEWVLDAHRTGIVETGTRVYIVGQYHFEAPPPWRSLEWLARAVDLPMLPFERNRQRDP